MLLPLSLSTAPSHPTQGRHLPGPFSFQPSAKPGFSSLEAQEAFRSPGLPTPSSRVRPPNSPRGTSCGQAFHVEGSFMGERNRKCQAGHTAENGNEVETVVAREQEDPTASGELAAAKVGGGGALG